MLESLGKREAFYTVEWECKLSQPLWRMVWRFLQKLKIELPYDLEIPPLGLYPRTVIIWKDTYTAVFTASLFTIPKTHKQSKCLLINERIKKMWYIYTMEYYSAIKKNKILLFAATWMNLEINMLREVRKKTNMISPYMWNIKNWYK